MIKFFVILSMILWSAFIILFWYFLCYRSKNLSKICTSKVDGKVIGYSSMAYGKIHIPLVEYYVNDVRYTIAGPRFKGCTIKINTFIEGEMESNITDKYNLPEYIKFSIKNGGNLRNPLCDIFPVGENVLVYYNLNNPKQAYVIRNLNYDKFNILFVGLLFLILIIHVILLIVF